MNQRIQELAEQAELNATLLFNKDKLEKFAELIVRECARVYWNIDDGEPHTEYVKSLKKHFGVEE